MKEIVLSGKKYNVPQNWGEVTLAMQIKVSNDTDKIELEDMKRFAILSGYANIPLSELKHAKLTELQELFKTVDFINEDLPTKPIVEFDFKGSHYYCGQNLLEVEFQDFISIENTLQAHSGNTYVALPTILAVMCKKMKPNGILETIDDYDVNKRAIEFDSLPLPIAHQLSLFFSTSEKLFGQLIPSFSIQSNQKLVVQKQIEEVENTLKQLAGKGWLTRCAILIFRYWLRLTKRHLDKHFTSTV